MRWRSALALLAIAASACAPAAPSPSRAGEASTAEAARAADAFTSSIGSLVTGFGGQAAIWISDPTEARPLYAHDADTPVVTASLYKLAVLLHVEGLVEAGRLTYGDQITITDADVTADGSAEPAGTVMTVNDALESMITWSDNGAALAFLRVLGPDKVNATLRAKGIRDFHVAESPDADNLVTARALGTFFAALADRRLLSPQASDRIIARLERQHVNDRLPRDLPAGTVVAHKTGDLLGSTHDAGIIQTPEGPRVVVALTTGARPDDAQNFIAALGALVYSTPSLGATDPSTRALSHAAAGGPPVGTITAIGAVGLAVLAVLGAIGWSSRRRDRVPPR